MIFSKVSATWRPTWPSVNMKRPSLRAPVAMSNAMPWRQTILVTQIASQVFQDRLPVGFDLLWAAPGGRRWNLAQGDLQVGEHDLQQGVVQVDRRLQVLAGGHIVDRQGPALTLGRGHVSGSQLVPRLASGGCAGHCRASHCCSRPSYGASRRGVEAGMGTW